MKKTTKNQKQGKPGKSKKNRSLPNATDKSSSKGNIKKHLLHIII